MASNYPTSIDSFTDPLSNSPLNSPSHAGQHQDINDAVEKLETKLGTGSSPAASATNGQLLVKGATDTSWQPITSVSSGAAATDAVLAANGTGGVSWNANVGMWLVKTQTIGTAVTSVVVSNAFSSSYDNYLITINGGTASTNGVFTLQLGSTTTGYYEVRAGFNLAGGTVINSTINGGFFYVGEYTTTGKFCYDTMLNPFNSTRTEHATSMFTFGTTRLDQSQGFLDNTTSYTGFTVNASAGTITGGTIRVYGYKN